MSTSFTLDYEMLSSEVQHLESKEKNRTPHLCRVKVRVFRPQGHRDFIGQAIFYPEGEGDWIQSAEEVALSRALTYAELRFERDAVEVSSVPSLSETPQQQVTVEKTVSAPPAAIVSTPEPQPVKAKPALEPVVAPVVAPVAPVVDQSEAERKLNGAMKLNDLWDEITEKTTDVEGAYEEAMTSLAKACTDVIGKSYVPMDPGELEEIALEDLLGLHKRFRQISKQLVAV